MSKTVTDQFNRMIENNIMPCIEYPITDSDGNKDWLIIDIDINASGVQFSFDSNDLPCFFNGDIKEIDNNNYLLPFDCSLICSNHLDEYLSVISDNIFCGFINANQLERVE